MNGARTKRVVCENMKNVDGEGRKNCNVVFLHMVWLVWLVWLVWWLPGESTRTTPGGAQDKIRNGARTKRVVCGRGNVDGRGRKGRKKLQCKTTVFVSSSSWSQTFVLQPPLNHSRSNPKLKLQDEGQARDEAQTRPTRPARPDAMQKKPQCNNKKLQCKKNCFSVVVVVGAASLDLP